MTALKLDAGVYRVTKRDDVKAGNWYYVLTCKNCGADIFLFDDPSQGKNKIETVGDGKLSTYCQKCLHNDTYPPNLLRLKQATENIPGTKPPRVQPIKASRKGLIGQYKDAPTTFGFGFVEDRPKAAVIIARIVTSWADVEVESARLLATLMGTNVAPAAAVFGSLRNSRAQHDALDAAARIVLRPDDYDLFTAHMKRKGVLEGERNDLAHGCFGTSPHVPDDVIWVSQQDYITFSAQHTAGNANASADFRNAQFVYELGTLERIAQEIEELYNQLEGLRGYFIARLGGTFEGLAFCATIYPQLCNQPHIQQALVQIRAGKTPPAARSKERPSKRRGKRK